MIGKFCVVLACAFIGSSACPPNGLGSFNFAQGPLDLGVFGYNLPSCGCNFGSCGLSLPSQCGLGLNPCGLLPQCPSNAGPCPAPLPVLSAPSVTIPSCPSPIIELPAPPVPPTKVIDNKCVCTKTVVKPQVYQRVVNVPSVKRFLKKSYTPVCEKIPYVANPAGDCGPCGSCGLPCTGACGLSCSGTCGLPCSGNCGLSCTGNCGLPFSGNCGLPYTGSCGLSCTGSCGLPCTASCGLPVVGSCGAQFPGYATPNGCFDQSIYPF